MAEPQLAPRSATLRLIFFRSTAKRLTVERMPNRSCRSIGGSSNFSRSPLRSTAVQPIATRTLARTEESCRAGSRPFSMIRKLTAAAHADELRWNRRRTERAACSLRPDRPAAKRSCRFWLCSDPLGKIDLVCAQQTAESETRAEAEEIGLLSSWKFSGLGDIPSFSAAGLNCA